VKQKGNLSGGSEPDQKPDSIPKGREVPWNAGNNQEKELTGGGGCNR